MAFRWNLWGLVLLRIHSEIYLNLRERRGHCFLPASPNYTINLHLLTLWLILNIWPQHNLIGIGNVRRFNSRAQIQTRLLHSVNLCFSTLCLPRLKPASRAPSGMHIRGAFENKGQPGLVEPELAVVQFEYEKSNNIRYILKFISSIYRWIYSNIYFIFSLNDQ